MFNRFFRFFSSVLAMLSPIVFYLLAFAIAPMDLRIMFPLFVSSLVNTCWLFQFCEEEWFGYKPGFFTISTAICFCFGMGWTGNYFLNVLYSVGNPFQSPVVIFCALLALSQSLPCIGGFIVRKVKDHNLFIPSYKEPSNVVMSLYYFTVFTPVAGLLIMLFVEIGFICAGSVNAHTSALATPADILELELWIYGILYLAGLPLGLLARWLFKKESKTKQPFSYQS